MRITYIALPLVLAACSSGANHIGNPLVLPFTGIATGIENQIYAGQRAPVEDYVGANYDALVSDILAGGGDTLDGAFSVAGLSDAQQSEFITNTMTGYDLSAADNIVVALMIHQGV
ncbi:MAG: hypothetical protein ACRBCL_02905 [Maritimibacter sp.]